MTFSSHLLILRSTLRYALARAGFSTRQSFKEFEKVSKVAEPVVIFRENSSRASFKVGVNACAAGLALFWANATYVYWPRERPPSPPDLGKLSWVNTITSSRLMPVATALMAVFCLVGGSLYPLRVVRMLRLLPGERVELATFSYFGLSPRPRVEVLPLGQISAINSRSSGRNCVNFLVKGRHFPYSVDLAKGEFPNPAHFDFLFAIKSSGHPPPSFVPSSLKRFWRLAFGRYLVVTNVFLGGGALCIGDIVSQTIELRLEGRRPGGGYDWLRTTRLTVSGLLFAVPMHHWLAFLERRFPGNAARQVAKKVALEQGLLVPLCLPLFLMVMAISRGDSWEKFKADAPKKGLRLWLMEVAIWPTAQAINFRLVPFPYRFAFANSVAFLEDILVSYIFHLDEDEVVEDQQKTIKGEEAE